MTKKVKVQTSGPAAGEPACSTPETHLGAAPRVLLCTCSEGESPNKRWFCWLRGSLRFGSWNCSVVTQPRSGRLRERFCPTHSGVSLSCSSGSPLTPACACLSARERRQFSSTNHQLKKLQQLPEPSAEEPLVQNTETRQQNLQNLHKINWHLSDKPLQSS